MSLVAEKIVSPPARPIIAAMQAIGLLVFVVLFNLTLYVGMIILVDRGLIGSQSAFPPLVLFLSFSLSIGIILIVLLRERIDTSKSENPLLRKFGFTPIMVIVAAICSVFATLTPWAKNIIPDPDYRRIFMLANVGVTCSTKNNNPPQATDMIVTIFSENADYIREVKRFLDNPTLMEKAKEKKFEYITQDPKNEFFKLLRDFSKLLDNRQSFALQQELRDASKWLAYRISLKDAGTRTFIPIPSRYGSNHTTRLFAVVQEFPDTPQPDLAALTQSTQPLAAIRKSISPLFQVEIYPLTPTTDPHLTDLNVEVITDHSCWHGVAS